jgi:putative flippase GtrA
MRAVKSLAIQHRDLIIQFLKFGIIGMLGFVVDWCFFHIALDRLGFNRYTSAAFSFPFAVTATWIGNRLFTFRGQNSGSVHMQWLRFFAVCAVGFIINRGTFSLLTCSIPLVYQYPVLGLLGGTGAGMFFNFFFARKLVFR